MQRQIQTTVLVVTFLLTEVAKVLPTKAVTPRVIPLVTRVRIMTLMTTLVGHPTLVKIIVVKMTMMKVMALK